MILCHFFCGFPLAPVSDLEAGLAFIHAYPVGSRASEEVQGGVTQEKHTFGPSTRFSPACTQDSGVEVRDAEDDSGHEGGLPRPVGVETGALTQTHPHFSLEVLLVPSFPQCGCCDSPRKVSPPHPSW